MQAQQTGRMANSSYVKLFFPCSENGADIDPLDTILAAQTNLTGVNSGDGLEVTIGIQGAASTIASGSFPTISETQSCILFTVIGTWSGFALVSHGDLVAGERIAYTQSATTLSVVTSDGSAQINDYTISDTSNAHGYAVAIENGGNIEFLVDGVVNGTPVARPTGTINPATDEMCMGGAHFFGHALFIFDGDLPSDYKEALAWMSNKWATGQKVIWPTWEDK